MASLLDGYEEPIEQQTPQATDGYVSLLDGYKEKPQKPISQPMSVKTAVQNMLPKVLPIQKGAIPAAVSVEVPASIQTPQANRHQQSPLHPLDISSSPIPKLPPQAGFLPMGQRIAEGAWQGLVNLPHAMVDFAKQSVDSGQAEFQRGYNPLLAFGAGSIGAMQGFGNLAEGVYNLPGDLNNAYWGYEKTKPTHPITQGIPNILGKTDWGKNYIENVDSLLQRYPLTAMLSQEVGEELPGMIGGAIASKFALKGGKIAQTAEKLSDVGYKKLAAHSALGGFTDGLIVDPAQSQQFNMTPEERRASRFTNAYTGAIIAPTLNVGMKGVADVGGKSVHALKENAPKMARATKEVSAKVFNGAKEFYNTANDRFSSNTAFDTMRKVSKGEIPIPKEVTSNRNVKTGSAAFDILRSLPKENRLKNSVPKKVASAPQATPSVEEIAPNIAEKQKAKKEQLVEKSKNAEQKIKDIDKVENEAVTIRQIEPQRQGSVIPKEIKNDNISRRRIRDIISNSAPIPEKEVLSTAQRIKKIHDYLYRKRNYGDYLASWQNLNVSKNRLQNFKEGDYVFDIYNGRKIKILANNKIIDLEKNETHKIKSDDSRYRQYITENKENDIKQTGLKIEELAPKTAAKQKAKNETKSTKIDYEKHIYEGWRVKDFIKNLEQHGIDDIMSGNNLNAIYSPFKTYGELKKWCMDYQPYYQKYIPDVVNHFAQKYNIPIEKVLTKKQLKNTDKKHDKTAVSTSRKPIESGIIKKENIVTDKTKGDINGLISTTDRIRPDKKRAERKQSQKRSKDSKRESRVNGSISQVGRGHDTGVLSSGRLISQHEELINASYKKQFELNNAIGKFIADEEYKKYNGDLPQELKTWLKKYSGAGGLEKQGAEGRGLLSEYYTPDDIVKQTWDLVKQHINTDGSKVLEPSVGIGRFFEHAPKNAKLSGIEMNPISSKIAELLYPNAKIKLGEFQESFIDAKNNLPIKKVVPEYDIIIGNPPYGKYAGRYKGLGEGKGIERFEHYFIKRGLDSLKDDGILAYIVPSNFLKGELSKVKSEISKNSVLVDAIRLPEKTFDTTSVGTDIIVLKKQKNLDNKSDFNLDNWFKKHPEKIMGETSTRMNRFGREETYVKKKDDSILLKEKKTQEPLDESKTIHSGNGAINNVPDNKTSIISPNVDNNNISEMDFQLFADTQVDGTLSKEKYSPSEYINQYEDNLYNDFNYLQGDIYEKLDSLENEKISKEQKKLQREKLERILPTPKNIKEIRFVPSSEFIRELSFGKESIKSYSTLKGGYFDEFIHDTLDKRFIEYVKTLTSSERDNVSSWDIQKFIKGESVRFNTYGSDEQKSVAKIEKATKLKNTCDELFNQFLQTQLTSEEEIKLKETWNRKFNAIYNPDYKTLPFHVENLSKTFFGKPLNILDVQKEGINFLTNKGVGLLGFEVGVGKTLAGIIATVQSMQIGRTKRPLILAPKQVKANWIREINQLFPYIKVNDIGNLSKFKGKINDGEITIGTYEALNNIWYDEVITTDESGANIRTGNIRDLIDKLYSVATDFNRDSTKRAREQQFGDIETIVGIAEKGNKKLFKIEDLGFDHITVDEAHNFRNLFRQAKAYGRENNAYQKVGSGGNPSARAARLFLLVQHILAKNNNRNVFFLTATPFNNSPLEVFNMLSFIGKDRLDKMGLNNVYQFMEAYVDITADWSVKNNNSVVFDQVVKGFKNAASLRELIKSLMMIRSADEAGVERPKKHVDRLILEPSDVQLDLIEQYESLAMRSKNEDGAILKCINSTRQVTLSPDISEKNHSVSPQDLIKNSPKLQYIANSIEIMQKKDPSTSQLLYMPLGVEFLPKIKDYFVEKKIFKDDEVAIISSNTIDENIPKITDSFNDPKGKIKLIIGTQRIKEGMNLNKNTSILYIPFIDWNPTDFIQIVGRIWRQGNKYNDVKVVVPLLKNSSDPFMFQKLDEKTSRINNIMDESKEYIETGELNTAEEKLNMITIPEKKVQLFESMLHKEVEHKQQELKGRLETSEHYQKELKKTNRRIDSLTYDLKDYKKQRKEATPTDESTIENLDYRIKNTEQSLKKSLTELGKIERTIEKLDLDFEGKDSKETITKELTALSFKKDEIAKKVQKKLEEYQKDYFEQKNNVISMETHTKNFKKSLDELYGKDDAIFESLPETLEDYKKTAQSDFSVSRNKLTTSSQIKAKKTRKAKIVKLQEFKNAKTYDKVVKEKIRQWASGLEQRRYTANRDLNFFMNHTKKVAKDLKVKDKLLREIMPFLRERTEIPKTLDRPDLKKVWNQLSKNDKEKLTKIADNISEKFEQYWKEYQTINAYDSMNVTESSIENHISHLWKTDNKQKTLLTNYYATKSRFAKKRTIETLFEGINGIETESGEIVHFEPKTLDYAEILKIQSDSMIKATVDKILADDVKNLKTTEGLSLVMPSHKAPSNWVEFDHSALNKTVVIGSGDSKFSEVISPKLQNILTEMGVAIGRRLTKYKPSGKPNALGKYIHSKVPPEIRLQKWFSNKTLAHEIGHAIDMSLNLTKNGFADKFKQELLEINKERIENFTKLKQKAYATKREELIAEFFGYFFNDFAKTYEIAPKATAHVLGLIENNPTFSKLLPISFDWKNAKHILEESSIQFAKTKVRVHPDIADTLNLVFEKQAAEPKAFVVYDNINSVLKQFNLSFSGFHAVALTEAALANLGIKSTLKILNPVKVFDAIKNNDWDIYKQDTLAQKAIEDGLQIGATLDVHRRLTEKIVEDSGLWAEKHIPILGKSVLFGSKVISSLQKLNNKVLWDYLHNNYKLATYQALVQAEAEKHIMTQAKRREIAQWVNDSYGGQVWENLEISPSGRKWEQRILLSPDWLRSTTRQAIGAISSKHLTKAINSVKTDNTFWKKANKLSEEWGIKDMVGDVEASDVRGRVARRFWLRAMIQFALYSNAINAVFRERDRKENPELYPARMRAKDYSVLGNSKGSEKYIFIGRNSDGTERYMRLGKQFREVPELATDFTGKIGGKMSPNLQLLSQTLTGHSLSGFENKEITKKKGTAKTLAIAKMWASSPLPYSLKSSLTPNKDVSAADFFAGTSKGMTFYKGQEYYQDAIKSGNKKDIEKITNNLTRNRVNASDAFKFAIKELKKEARYEAKRK